MRTLSSWIYEFTCQVGGLSFQCNGSFIASCDAFINGMLATVFLY